MRLCRTHVVTKDFKRSSCIIVSQSKLLFKNKQTELLLIMITQIMSESEQKAHQCPSGAVGWDKRPQDEITLKRINSSYSPPLLLMLNHNNDKLRSQTHVRFLPLQWEILGNLTVKDWFSIEQGKLLPLLFEATCCPCDKGRKQRISSFPILLNASGASWIQEGKHLLVQNLNSCSNGVLRYLYLEFSIKSNAVCWSRENSR